jgi:hypothetical protein
MIPKSGNRFSDKIMLDQKDTAGLESDSTQLNQTPERFRAKHVLGLDPRMWIPVRVKKTRQIKIIEPRF